MLRIRKITPADLSFVMELTRTSNIIKGKLLENIENFLVCENSGKLCGCGCLTAKNQKGYMNWIAVNPEDRRNKLGSAIVKALLNIAEHNGVKTVYSPGICPEFLETLGFSEASCCSASAEVSRILGTAEDCKIYEVALEGYFKPCCAE